jgi:hypothetical protein
MMETEGGHRRSVTKDGTSSKLGSFDLSWHKDFGLR